MHEEVDNPALRWSWAEVVGCVIACAALVYVAFGPALDNYFYEIDDARHLLNGAGGPFPNGYFRPGQELSFRLLYSLFGFTPFPYHLLGQLMHLGNSLLVVGLVWRLFRRKRLAVLSGAVFATLFAPHQAVLWIGAHLGVQSLFFVLLACHALLCFLETRSVLSACLTLLFAICGMCFKESGLNVMPMFLVLVLFQRRSRALLSGRGLLLSASLLCVAAWVTWRGVTVDAGIGLSVELPRPLHLLDRLLRSVGQFPLPLNFRAHRPGLQGIGVFVLCGPLVLAYLCKRRNPQALRETLLALAFLLAGHCAVLPVEPEAIGMRSYYDAAVGMSLLFAIGIEQLCSLVSSARFRPILVWALGACLVLVHVFAIRRIEAWKYEPRSLHVERLVDGTGRELEIAPPGKNIVFLDPPLPDIRDFDCFLRTVLRVPDQKTESFSLLPQGETLLGIVHGREGDLVRRWDARREVWIPFDPSGAAWLTEWKPTWWQGGLEDPRISKKLRAVRVHR